MVMLTYASGDGNIQRQTMAVADRKVKFTGVAPEWTSATVTASNGDLIAICVLRNGDHLKIEVPEGEFPEVKIKGSKHSKQLAQFIAEHRATIMAGETDSINEAVTDFIIANPESPLSALLLTNFYSAADNELKVDSLLMSITPEARPMSILRNFGAVNGALLAAKSERIYSFALFIAAEEDFKYIRPSDKRQTLLAILPNAKQLRTPYVERLRNLQSEADSLRLRTIEISFAPDSASWRSSIAADSAKWMQAWAPGNAAATPLRRLAIPRQPFFILIDSLGNQIYRGADINKALSTAQSNI